MKWAVYFMVLLRGCDEKRSHRICERFKLAPKFEKLFCIQRIKAEKSLYYLEKIENMKNSILYKNLSSFETEQVLYMMAVTKHKKIKHYISDFCTKLRYVKISVTGKDLIQMGIKPGPIYHRILQAILEAKLNGLVNTKTEELEFVNSWIIMIPDCLARDLQDENNRADA
jgi:tRNA nucleotidyltransferase (CCA-adding enzyme)